jgi:Short C-terminal domain
MPRRRLRLSTCLREPAPHLLNAPPAHMMHRPWGNPSHSALQILNERFARGEFQKDEYAEKKAALLSA